MKDLLIPIQKSVSLPGKYSVPARVLVASAHEVDAMPAWQLVAELKRLGVRARFALGGHPPDVLLLRDRSLAHSESYELSVSADGIEIVSATDAGAYYGVQTLRELLRVYGRKIPCCRITDWPDFARRGVYLDCSRGKVPTVSTVKQLIERLAHWKMNELQLYIENVFTYKKHPLIGRGFSPFKPQDIKEIQAHCRLHHITFVPSLASIGHMEKILMLPTYAKLGEMPGFRGLPGGTTLCPGDPGSIRLLADLYGEFLPLCEAEDFNVCGDEPWELGKGRSKARASRVGEGRVYLDFMLKIREICLKHGKRMNMWCDIVLKHEELIPLLPKDIVILNWDYLPGGRRVLRTHEVADAGLPFMCCSGTHGWRSHGSRLRLAMANVREFTKLALRNGAEGMLQTDWGDHGHRNPLGVSLCSYAHAAAHAWHGGGVEEKSHLRRFALHTFGDRTGEIAAALDLIDSTPEEPGVFSKEQFCKKRKFLQDGGLRGKYMFWRYYALLEPLRAGVTLKPHAVLGNQQVFGRVGLSKAGLQKQLRKLNTFSLPAPAKGLAEFDRLVLEEYALAAEMDRLAGRRVQLADAVRDGRPPKSKELKTHASEMTRMAERFKTLWLARSRPSRLNDNLGRMRAAVREARTLAK